MFKRIYYIFVEKYIKKNLPMIPSGISPYRNFIAFIQPSESDVDCWEHKHIADDNERKILYHSIAKVGSDCQ